MAEIRKADDWGLSARDFVLPQAISGDATPSALADAEIKIALAVLKYARQARGGRFKPLQLSPDLDQTPNIRDPKRVLREITAAETADSYLRSLHPKNPQFKMLREALLRARGRSNKAEYVAPPSRPIRSARSDAYPGDERSGAYVPWQDRGNGEDAAPNDDDYDPDDNPDRRAPQPQAREPIPGSNDDVRRIIVNMERWRWMPDELGAFYVWDNVPEFTTRVMKNGKIIHDDKIIVGKRNTPTTVFSAKMQYIVFHPEWAVPDSIKVNEIQPYLRFEPGFLGIGGGMDTSILQQQNLRVVYNGNQIDPSRIDWRKVDIRQFQFLQAPGDKNVLGTLKFRFPNKHDIYMHDTPERALFSRSMRALSHGCMRVQNPQRLAEVLLAEDKGWPTSEISARLEHGYNTEVELSRKIPVHITYFTAVAGEGGKVQFFGDIYGYDTMMASALDGRPLRSAVQYPDEPEVSAATRRSSSSRQAGGLDNFFSILLGF